MTLQAGDMFPTLALTLPGGDTINLPEALAGRYGVVLFNRGSWCPYCNAQLRAFQRAHEELDAAGAAVVSVSVDDEETTRALIAKHGLQFPVGHSADADAFAAATGAFVNQDPKFLQSTGFVLGPDGRVLVAVYSTGAIGRLVPQDVVGVIRHMRERAGDAAA